MRCTYLELALEQLLVDANEEEEEEENQRLYSIYRCR